MKLKISILTAVFFSLFITANAFKPMNTPSTASTFEQIKSSKGNELLNMTPKEFQKLTGKKLTLKEVIQLKAAQKVLKAKMHKKDGDGVSKGIFILVALLGWAWLLMGVQDDFSGNTWIVNLLLTALCWLPGFIHALVHMKDYTK